MSSAPARPERAAMSTHDLHRICRKSFNVLRVIIGVFLLVAAALKLYGWSVDPVARVGLFWAPWFQVLVILFEVMLGAWLVSGTGPMEAWLATLATFAVFAAVSFYAGWMGQATCGCLGAVKASPWWAFGFDLGILALLAMFRPTLGDWPTLREGWRCQVRPVLATAGTMLGILVFLWIGAQLSFGSVPAAVAWLRGENVSVHPGLVDLGHGATQELAEARISVANWSTRPIRVVGGTVQCSCVATDQLPVVVMPGQSEALTVRVILPRTPGIFRRRVMLIVSCLFSLGHSPCRSSSLSPTSS